MSDSAAKARRRPAGRTGHPGKRPAGAAPRARRLRVTYILEATEGGKRRHLLDLLRHIDRSRFEPSLLFSARRDPAFRDDVQDLQQAAVRCIDVPMVRAVRPWADLRAWRGLVRHLRKLQPDLVHTHSSKAGMIGRAAARRGGVAAVVHTPHGFPFTMDVSPARRALYRVLERRAAGWSNAIVCVSREEARLARTCGIAAGDALRLIPNGVDPAGPGIDPARRDTLRRELGAGPRCCLVGAVGRLSRQKGFDVLLRAVHRLQADRADLRCVVIGDGEDRPALEALQRELGLRRHVQFLGQRSDAQALTAACDILAAPSRWEGLPYAVLDAMACGVPVAAGRVGGIVDAVADGETGLLVARDDPSGLADALARLAGDRELRKRLGQAAARRIRDAFPLERMVQQIEALYEELAGPG